MPPLPLSPYAVQKLACEYYIQAFYRTYGLEGVCLRYFNIFGPRQAADSPYSGVIAKFTTIDDGRRDSHHLRRRPHQPRLQLRRQRGQRQPARLPGAQHGGHGPRLQHRDRERATRSTRSTPPSPASSDSPASRSTARRARATFATRWPTSAAPAKSLATSPRPTSTRACKRPWPGTSPKKRREPPRRSDSRTPRHPYPSFASSSLASLDVLLLGASAAAFFRCSTASVLSFSLP